MAMLLINGVDYSAHVIAGSYSVTKEPVGVNWTDGFKVNRFEYQGRERVSGSFDMFFRTMAEYNAFLTDLDAVYSLGFYALTVKLNNIAPPNDSATGNFKFKFSPVRNIDGLREDYIQRFTVTIEEA